uniref:DUF4704 domain-containing protein n=1 Tax=Rhodosorus marinus TaxID=101924 RepID=A0A7S2ZD69_9RHOD
MLGCPDRAAFVNTLNELVKSGGRSALEIIRASGLIVTYAEDCLNAEFEDQQAAEIIMELFASAAEAGKGDVGVESLALVRAMRALGANHLNVERTSELLNVLSSMFVAAGDGCMWEILKEDTLSSLAQVAKSFAATRNGEDDISGKIMLTLNSLVSHPLGLYEAIRSEEFLWCLRELLGYRQTIPLASNYCISLIVTHDEKLSSQVSTGSGAKTRGGLQRQTSLRTDDLLQNRKEELFECLITAAKEAKHFPSLSIVLQGLRAILGTTSADRASSGTLYRVRDVSIFEMLLDVLTQKEYRQEEEERISVVSEILKTIGAIARRHGDESLFVDWEKLRDNLEWAFPSMRITNLDKILAIILSDDTLTFESLIGSHGEYAEGLRISHPQALRLLIRMCLENTDLELKLRVFTVLRDLVGANSPNKAVCGEAGVIDLLIEDHVQWSGDRHLAAVVCAVIGRIAQYYITPETMYRLFNLVHSSKSFLPSLLLDAVESAISAGKPVAEFDLVGFRSGLLATNALTNFPPSKSGFSIVLWFRPNAINRKNILLTMFGSTGNSIEVSFCNGSFSYSEMSSKSREFADSSVTSTLPLSASEWTHVVITHSAPSMFGHSGEVDIFHNGKRLIRRSMKYPRFPSDTASVALGFSPATGSNNFNGQIASVAIVSDIIKLEHCQALTFLGHQFFPALSPTDNSLQRLLTLKTVPSMCNSLLEGKTLLTEKVILLFPAKAGDLGGCPTAHLPVDRDKRLW